MVGGLILGPVTRNIGYRRSVVGCDAVVLIGWLLMSQVNLAPVWAIRFAHGIGTGGLGLLIPTYIAHITDFRIRGRALVFHHAFVCFGVFFAHSFSAIVTNYQLTGVCMVWPALHIFVSVFMPESPLYAYKCQGDSDLVRTAIRHAKGADYDVDSDCMALERYVFEFECMIDDNRSRLIRKMVAIGAKLVVLQQTCGASATMFHAKSVFGGFGLTTEIAGYSDERVYSNTQTIVTIVSAVQVLLCLTTVELVEFLGRKFMLIASAIGMGTCLALLMLYQSFYPTTDICTSPIESNEWHKYVPVVLVCMYLCSYSIGWGPVVPLVYAEVVYFDKWFSSLIYAGGQFVLFLVAYTFFDANALLSFNKYVMYEYQEVKLVKIREYQLPGLERAVVIYVQKKENLVQQDREVFISHSMDRDNNTELSKTKFSQLQNNFEDMAIGQVDSKISKAMSKNQISNNVKTTQINRPIKFEKQIMSLKKKEYPSMTFLEELKERVSNYLPKTAENL
ncbi:PREDICTED: sugar transporter ERD6-like 5 [Diuraphis noxia]|uniref:sugar transporter ERD6-like 5 n=1 Tax=Diuraphis noxia TaxID=143948 RepID=UPI00076360C8|nr:PREDICTED: sugar transporter ERD6-like 5 [Diuraphis noxia]